VVNRIANLRYLLIETAFPELANSGLRKSPNTCVQDAGE
jgi:hypothetical protein